MIQADIQDGQYVDLSLNPERFTGYAGPSAHHVWQTIYEENCFGLSEASLDTTQVSEKQGMAMAAGFSSSSLGSAGAPGLSHGWGTDMVKSTPEGEMCEEKKVYYRVISGQLSKSEKNGCQLMLRSTCLNLDTYLSRVPRPADRSLVAKSAMLH